MCSRPHVRSEPTVGVVERKGKLSSLCPYDSSESNPGKRDTTMPSNRENNEQSSNVSASDLGALIQVLKDQAPPKKVPWSRRETRSSFAKGKKKNQRSKLTRTFYTNGIRCNPKQMDDGEIDLVNKLEAGRYANGLLTVHVKQSTGSDPDQVELHYSNKTPDQRMSMMQRVGIGLVAKLRRCIEEAEQRKAARATT